MLDFPAFLSSVPCPTLQHWRIPTAAFPPPRCNWSSEFKTKEQATNLYHRADSPWSFWPQYQCSRLGLWDAKLPPTNKWSLRHDHLAILWPNAGNSCTGITALQFCQVALEPMDREKHLSLGSGRPSKNFTNQNCRLRGHTLNLKITNQCWARFFRRPSQPQPLVPVIILPWKLQV